MTSTGFTLFHNPACSTSRKVLALLREAGHDPVVVEYLKTGWTRPQLVGLLKTLHATPPDILRAKEAIAKDLSLATADDETILAAMIAHPVLVERPIVMGPKGAAVCRPVDGVKSLL